jgi:acetolactate synthase small subunit
MNVQGLVGFNNVAQLQNNNSFQSLNNVSKQRGTQKIDTAAFSNAALRLASADGDGDNESGENQATKALSKKIANANLDQLQLQISQTQSKDIQSSVTKSLLSAYGIANRVSSGSLSLRA